ncbi:MAG: RtcB family protein [Clostridiales bacterium]|jgi:RNA-splicing ligase RtcB|nr:RtcB family protein [Clostridiales bacterium]
MKELKGKYNTAKVFTDSAESGALAQVLNLLDQEFVSGAKIRIMPDTHAGAGCTIGTTMTISDKVVPNLVGVDIGCGMETAVLRNSRVELEQLDKAVHRLIPSGFDIRETPHRLMEEIDLTRLRCARHVNLERAELSLGTLGGGNHFIELDRDQQGRLYFVVHSGSRHLGKQVAEYYQEAAAKELKNNSPASLSAQAEKLIAALKREGRETEIQAELKKLREAASRAGEGRGVPRGLAFAEGRLMEDYIHDMAITQRYAELNRLAIMREIVKEMKFKVDEQLTTVHNYIDMGSMILRKGAISARLGERVLIPINMRDGGLICIGKGNPDWNYSAPHGAGRLMSRSDARASITLTQYERAMQGIYSTTVNKNTIDESPFAYKPMEEIIANIGDTVEIEKIIKPLYNFKAADE